MVVRKFKKWVDRIDPSSSVVKAARQSVRLRLSAVLHYLPLAAESPRKQIENVHQLRVATRKSMAALQLYRDYLPPKRAERMSRSLRRIRRAAGEARDLDVLLQRFSAHHPEAEEAESHPQLLRLLKRQRRRAQRRLTKVAEVADGIRRESKALCSRIRFRMTKAAVPCRDFSCFAALQLQQEFEQFRQRWPAEITETEVLHQFRIHCKQLRYIMELLATAFPSAFRDELYLQIEALQDGLGRIHDRVVAAEILNQLARRCSKSSLKSYLRQSASQEVDQQKKAVDELSESWQPRCPDKLIEGFRAMLSEPKVRNSRQPAR